MRLFKHKNKEEKSNREQWIFEHLDGGHIMVYLKTSWKISEGMGTRKINSNATTIQFDSFLHLQKGWCDGPIQLW